MSGFLRQRQSRIVSNRRERCPRRASYWPLTHLLCFPFSDLASTFDQVLGHTELEVTEAAVHIVLRRRRMRKAHLASRCCDLPLPSLTPLSLAFRPVIRLRLKTTTEEPRTTGGQKVTGNKLLLAAASVPLFQSFPSEADCLPCLAHWPSRGGSAPGTAALQKSRIVYLCCVCIVFVLRCIVFVLGQAV